MCSRGVWQSREKSEGREGAGVDEDCQGAQEQGKCFELSMKACYDQRMWVSESGHDLGAVGLLEAAF